MTLAIAYDIMTQALSSNVAPRLPLMCDKDTLTMEVSINSITAAAMTVVVSKSKQEDIIKYQMVYLKAKKGNLLRADLAIRPVLCFHLDNEQFYRLQYLI